MSLTAILKDTDRYSAWPVEKTRLKRLIVGVCLIAAVLTAAGIWFKANRAAHKDTPDAKTLATLMQVQDDAKAMQTKVDQMRLRQPAQNQGQMSAHSIPRIVHYDPGEGFLDATPAKEKPYIPTGAVFLARLITPIKTSVEKTFVIAETTHEYRMDSKRRIPKGSRLVGRSHLNPILKGVIVEFDTLVWPNGIETPLKGLALSRDALPEIDGLYFSNSLENYGTALAFGFLSGFAGGAREREITPLGSLPKVNLSNQVLSGLSTASFQVAENILQDIRSRAVEYVVVPAGEQIFVALTGRYEIQVAGSL